MGALYRGLQPTVVPSPGQGGTRHTSRRLSRTTRSPVPRTTCSPPLRTSGSSRHLRRQRHLQLDLLQLFRRRANLAEERQPARIVADIREQRLDRYAYESAVVIRDRLVEPFKRLIRLASKRKDVGNVVWTVPLFLRD